MKTNRILSLLCLLAAFFILPAFDVNAREMCKDGQYEYYDHNSGELKCQENQVGEEGKSRGCEDLNDRLGDAEKCMFCPLFKVLYEAAHTMAETSTDTLAKPISIALVVAFAVYIAFSALGYVSSFTKQDAPKYLTGLLTMAFKVLVVYLLLGNVGELYTLFINPLLMAGLDFGGNMLFGEGANTMAECKAGASGTLVGILPDGLYQGLECYIKAIQQEIAFGQAAGGAIWCFGLKELASLNLGSGFGLLGQGAIVYLCSLLLSFAFAFYLIDTVVQLGIFGALLCFLMACWPFKITSGYTSAGFKLLMNAFFVFVFMGVVVSINVVLIAESLTNEGGLGALKDALNNDKIDVVKKTLDWSFGGFLILLCCTIFGFKFCAQASALAGQFAGGGGAEIGRNIGGMAASAVVKPAKKIGKAAAAPITAAVSRQASKAYDGVKHAVFHPIQTAKSAYSGGKKRVQNAIAFGKQNAAQKALGMDKWAKPQTPAAQNGGASPASVQDSANPANNANTPNPTTPNPAIGGAGGVNTPNQQNPFNGTGPMAANGNTPGTGGGAQAAAANQFTGNMDSKILEEARQMQQKALENYEKAKAETAQAFAVYHEIAEKVAQAQQEVNMAKAALDQAKGTPQEAAAQAALQQAQSKFEALHSQKAAAEATATASRQNMNSQAVSYHVNSSKAAAYAAGNGNSFDAARAAAEASANNLGRITAEMDRVLEAQPRPENTGSNPENIGSADGGTSTLDSVNPEAADGSNGNYDEAVQKAMQAAEEQKRLYEETQKADEEMAQKQAKIQSDMQSVQNEIDRLNGGGGGKKPDNKGDNDSDKLKALQNNLEQLKRDMQATQNERSALKEKGDKLEKTLRQQEQDIQIMRGRKNTGTNNGQNKKG
ncbi:MAG: hypothetical protein J6L86_03700 [Alphaproteobacteria bacterium]|nr:hypothetical protein [Alphaproteobacteria bacterium]